LPLLLVLAHLWLVQLEVYRRLEDLSPLFLNPYQDRLVVQQQQKQPQVQAQFLALSKQQRRYKTHPHPFAPLARLLVVWQVALRGLPPLQPLGELLVPLVMLQPT
jgi:hypothetical protein